MSTHPRILIVEDDAAIGAFVQTALEREGFVSELVKRGDTALERAEAFSPRPRSPRSDAARRLEREVRPRVPA